MPEMAINKNNSQEIDRNSRIYEEYKRLSDLFEELSAEEFAVLYPTLKQAAFMRITLEDLADLITKEGCVEAYQNGEHQHGQKQSAALQSYNATIKNYAATVKMLFEKLPRKKKQIAFAQKTPEEIAKEKEEQKHEAEYWAAEAKKLLDQYGGRHD